MSTNCTYIDGIGSSQAIDTAGEVVELKGLDISSLVGAAFNFEHESKLPSQIVGKILEAHKIYSEEDCLNDRHRIYWKKCQLPFLYVMGRLFDDKKASSKEVAALFQDDAEHPNEAKMLSFSIEGAKIEKVGMVITRSIARKCTITHIPANKTCIAEMLPEAKESRANDISSLFKGEMELFKFEPTYVEIMEKKDDLEKSVKVGTGSGVHISGGAHGWTKPTLHTSGPKAGTQFYHPKHGTVSVTKHPKGSYEVKHNNDSKGTFGSPHEATGHAHSYMANLSRSEGLDKADGAGAAGIGSAGMGGMVGGGAIIGSSIGSSFDKKKKKNPLSIISNISSVTSFGKSMEAGSGMAAPSQLTQGAALAKESLEKPKLKKKEKSQWYERADQAYSTWDKKSHFKSYMQKRMPHLAEGEIDAIGRVLALRKTLQAEGKLSKMYAHYSNKSDKKE